MAEREALVKRIQNVVIPNGQALSGEIDLAGFQSIAIEMPVAWTAANLTFQVASTSGGTFKDLHDDAGTEVTVTAAASRVIGLRETLLAVFSALRFVKIRSGTSATPVNQGADRTLTLILKS